MHPGAILRLYLWEQGISVARFADLCDIPRPRMYGLVQGRCRIRAYLALRISRVLRTPPEVWMQMQTHYDLWGAVRRVRERDVKPLR